MIARNLGKDLLAENEALGEEYYEEQRRRLMVDKLIDAVVDIADAVCELTDRVSALERRDQDECK